MPSLHDVLEEKYRQYNRPDFIADDPISIPHRFSRRQDIEITGFFAAVLAWGQRKTIISKCSELIGLMDGAPYDFVHGHQENDLKRFLQFKHRTFNATDALYFIDFLRAHYARYDSLEDAFVTDLRPDDGTVERGLVSFRNYFFAPEYAPQRTRKHISSPAAGSACKRLNMFLRWMVRRDDKGVDFGLWVRIRPGQLVCPCDVHVERMARRLGLITRKQMDWLTALQLTENLRQFDPADPVKYDFALFGLGLEDRYALPV
ncbi:MAG: TIGR02757 family protein [Cytophagales bacterium]|nr:TIGR02757 family protein [Cytophagales bacterium]